MTKAGEYLVTGKTLGLQPSTEVHAKAVAGWMSRDEFDLFMTSSSLPFPVTPEAFEAYRIA